MTDAMTKLNRFNKITYLDGTRFHRALVAGIQEVISRQDYLNRINVFPVPDRDTGTNMALTLNTIIEETSQNVSTSIGSVLEQVADAALNGARGNSGSILAQFFQGLSEGAEKLEKAGTAEFVYIINQGVTFAHKALSEPKEGTILSVIKAFGDALQNNLNSCASEFTALLEPSIKAADEALADTANQLPEMRKAKVVDAGAQGFVDLLHGIYDFICNGQVRGFYDNLATPVIDEVEEHIHEFMDTTFRYCTECLIQGNGIDHDALRAALDEHGNSLIVAGSPRKTKIHIHCNDPASMFEVCREYGQVNGEKADDMLRQQRTINENKTKIAILTDSSADIPSDVLEKLDIHVVPITINFGPQSYIDKISLGPKAFYKKLRQSPIHPTTSQPSFGDFNRTYQFISSHYDSIIAIHLPKKVSGTLNSSANAAKRVYNKPVSIVDSMSTTAGLGLVVQYAAEAAQAGFRHNQILKMLQPIVANTHMFAVIPDLTSTVRGGRLSSSKKRMADLMRLTPIVGFDHSDGSITTVGMLPGRKNITNKFLNFVIKKIDTDKKYRMLVSHCDAIEEAENFAALLKKHIPQVTMEIPIVDCCAALGVHAGPGSIGVGIQEYQAPAELLETLKQEATESVT